ncbi:cytidylyltransferase domain-containing protein [Paucibacter sp. KCTC 42545]|uniref:cytidylyltransferase domain-containing protein n=1 Tax=Paucibacter sp. KCTC 42545 TaxID=1768242 RepID=UPI001E4D3C5C|nr:glycosyltransferase family protein [Paucibacter sp. KCTC 42545]
MSSMNPRPSCLAIVQARLSSSRLPGKVLMPLAGMPMILFMLERVKRATLIDQIVLATSTDPSDDALAAAVREAGYAVHRGPLDDVLTRFAGAAQASDAELIVRLTGDCPLIDPALIDRVISQLCAQKLDYCTNSEPASYPDGLDVEVFTRQALLQAAEHARLPSEREHVTPWLRAQAQKLRIGSLSSVIPLAQLRWTVDHLDDLHLVRALVDALDAQAGAGAALRADLFDFLRLLDARPELLRLNPHQRNEGYAKSLRNDALQAAAAQL